MKPCMLVLLEHHLCGFDHSGNRVTDFQFHFFGAPSGYYTVDDVVPDDSNHNMSHHTPEGELLDLADQVIACGEFHRVDDISALTGCRARK